MNLYLYIFAALNIVVVIAGIVGNALVITVVRKTRSMRTTTNYLLVNLAVADIITLLFNPLLHERIWPQSFNSGFLCKFLSGSGFVVVPMSVSLFTLQIIAVERYHALLKPMATRLRLTRENVHYAIITTWCVAVALNIPVIVDYQTDKSCNGAWDLDFSADWTARYIIFCCSVAIAATFVMSYCYFQIFRGLYITNTICPESTSTEQDRKSKKKLAKLLLLVSALFYVSVFPFDIFMIYKAFKRELEESDRIILDVSTFLIMANSCVNPFVYAFRSENYKSGFKRIFRRQTLSSGDDPAGPYPLNEYGV